MAIDHPGALAVDDRQQPAVDQPRLAGGLADKGGGNARIAERLRQAASLLAVDDPSPFRAAAYRRAADAILALPDDLGAVALAGGWKALEAIPGVGPSIAGAIAEMLTTGRWSFLERLKGAADPDLLFRSVPGIGAALARRIHEQLHIETLEALEAAAHDGRLEQVPGISARRAAMVRGALAELLARVRPRPVARGAEPEVAVLLDVDREYRAKAARGELRKIAPKRFNPGGEAWLPILHAERPPWHFTALYSNTARAHQLGRLNDWVIIYFSRDGAPDGQRTVVTESHAPARGRRVVRGRELESQNYGVR